MEPASVESTERAPEAPVGPLMGRRRFIRALMGFSVFSTIAMIATPIIGFLIPPKTEGAVGGGRVLAGTTADIPAGSGKVVAMGSKPVIVVNTEAGVKAYLGRVHPPRLHRRLRRHGPPDRLPVPRRPLQPGQRSGRLGPAAATAAPDQRRRRGQQHLPGRRADRWRRARSQRPQRPAGWLEERLRASQLFAALLHVRIPTEARTYYLGGITLFLFGIQVVTGTLLALYYKPTPETAYDSVKFITSTVDFGWLIRSIHHWAANLMIISLVLHLIRIFIQGAYKYPRELIWVVGVGLLAVTIGFGFTGYLLPWDQRAFWATTVGTDMAGAVPGIGDSLLRLLRGGDNVTEATLSRFFGMHVLVLPLLLGGLVAIHLTIVHQLGLASPKRPEPRPGRPVIPPPDGGTERLKPFFPHYILDEVIAWAIILALLVVLASILPAGLEDKADPLKTPEHVKPEWYFLSVYQLLKVVPAIGPLSEKTMGVVIPMLAIAVLLFLPFIDRNPEVMKRRRPIALLAMVVTLLGLVALTVWGQVS